MISAYKNTVDKWKYKDKAQSQNVDTYIIYIVWNKTGHIGRFLLTTVLDFNYRSLMHGKRVDFHLPFYYYHHFICFSLYTSCLIWRQAELLKDL